MSSLIRQKRGTTLSLIGLTQTNKINHLSHARPLQVSKMGLTMDTTHAEIDINARSQSAIDLEIAFPKAEQRLNDTAAALSNVDFEQDQEA